MTPEQYLDYLIETCEAHARGETSIGVQPVELRNLKVLFESEKAHLKLNGNPA